MWNFGGNNTKPSIIICETKNHLKSLISTISNKTRKIWDKFYQMFYVTSPHIFCPYILNVVLHKNLYFNDVIHTLNTVFFSRLIFCFFVWMQSIKIYIWNMNVIHKMRWGNGFFPVDLHRFYALDFLHFESYL